MGGGPATNGCSPNIPAAHTQITKYRGRRLPSSTVVYFCINLNHFVASPPSHQVVFQFIITQSEILLLWG